MPINNEFYLTKSEAKNDLNFDSKQQNQKPSATSVFQFSPMNLNNKVSYNNTSISSGNCSNVHYSKTINESPSGGMTIKINTNKKSNNLTPVRSENLNKTSISDKHISKILHATSSKDSGKIIKRANDKSKKMSAFSVRQCYNLAEKEKYRQLIEDNMCKAHPTRNQESNAEKVAAINGGNHYQNFVKSSPKEVKDDSSLNLKSRQIKMPTIELPVSQYLSKSFNKRDGRLSVNSNSNNSIISLSSNSNSKKNYSINESTTIADKKPSNNNKIFNGSEKLNNHVNNTCQSNEAAAKTKSLLSTRVIATSRKIMRPLNDYENSYEQRISKNNEIIESIFEKCNSKYQSNSLSEEEFKFDLIKRRRKEEEIKLAKEFSERLQLDVNKIPQFYFEEEVIDYEFPELNDEQQRLITNSLISFPDDEILAKGFNIDIRRKDLQTLKGLNWLNDEVINFYMNLITSRSEAQNDLKTYSFATFFYPRLSKDGFKGVQRWTKKVDIFSYNIILVPIHLGLHWTLAVIDISSKEIRYYDSMNGYNNECLKSLKNYIRDEHFDKKKQSLDLTQWNAIHVQDIPQQMNGSDCGMFTCKYAEFISRGKTAFSFNQSNMPYYRRRMIYEIVTKKLL